MNDAMPELPEHPTSLNWSSFEAKAIRAYGQACFTAGQQQMAYEASRLGWKTPADEAPPSDGSIQHEAAAKAHRWLIAHDWHREGEFFVEVTRNGAQAIHVSTVALIVAAALASSPSTAPQPPLESVQAPQNDARDARTYSAAELDELLLIYASTCDQESEYQDGIDISEADLAKRHAGDFLLWLAIDDEVGTALQSAVARKGGK